MGQLPHLLLAFCHQTTDATSTDNAVGLVHTKWLPTDAESVKVLSISQDHTTAKDVRIKKVCSICVHSAYTQLHSIRTCFRDALFDALLVYVCYVNVKGLFKIPQNQIAMRHMCLVQNAPRLIFFIVVWPC